MLGLPCFSERCFEVKHRQGSPQSTGAGSLRAPLMEGDPTGTAMEWTIRLALLALAVAAVWTVFGDDIAAFVGK